MSTAGSGIGDDHDIDRLYRLPLAEFTQARNDLSKALRAQGAREEADRVKALKKPSVTAWAANQVVHHYPERWAELVEATDQVRAVHTEGAGELAPALQRRKQALAAAVEAATGVLSRAEHNPGLPQLRRVGNTLDALASGVAEQRPGRVAGDLEPPGFGALVGLTLASPLEGRATVTPPAKAAPRRTTAGKAPAKAPPRGSVRGGGTTGAAGRARALEKAARERRAKAEKAVARARAEVERLEGEVGDAEGARATAERQHGEAAATVDAARAALEAARRHLDEAQASEAGLRRRLEKLRKVETRAESALAEARAALAEAMVTLERSAS